MRRMADQDNACIIPQNYNNIQTFHLTRKIQNCLLHNPILAKLSINIERDTSKKKPNIFTNEKWAPTHCKDLQMKISADEHFAH